MNEYKVYVCIRVRGEEVFRLYIERAADVNEAISKAEDHARRESLIPVPNKSRVVK